MKKPMSILALAGILSIVPLQAQGAEQDQAKSSAAAVIARSIEFLVQFDQAGCKKRMGQADYSCLLSALAAGIGQDHFLQESLGNKDAGKVELEAVPFSIHAFALSACKARAGLPLDASLAIALDRFQTDSQIAPVFLGCLSRARSFLNQPAARLPFPSETSYQTLSSYLKHPEVVQIKFNLAIQLCDPQMGLKTTPRKIEALERNSWGRVKSCWTEAANALVQDSAEIKTHFALIHEACDLTEQAAQKPGSSCKIRCDGARLLKSAQSDAPFNMQRCLQRCASSKVGRAEWACYSARIKKTPQLLQSLEGLSAREGISASEAIPMPP